MMLCSNCSSLFSDADRLLEDEFSEFAFLLFPFRLDAPCCEAGEPTFGKPDGDGVSVALCGTGGVLGCSEFEMSVAQLCIQV